LKPFIDERIRQTLLRIKTYQKEDRHMMSKQIDKVLEHSNIQVNKLPVEKNGKIMLLNYDEILYAYASTGMVKIVTDTEEINYNGSLSDLEDRLYGTHLLRVHKSYLVNMDKVEEVVPWFKGTYWLKMTSEGKHEIPVSKSQIKEIKTILGLK
jgi:two-component system LytT family response regulator/two-component system response regulator LytT